MKNDYKDIFLYIRDVDSEYVKNESEIFLRNSCKNNELFDEIEDDFSGYYNNMIDILYIQVYIYYKNNNKKREIIIRISLLEIENKDIKMIKFKRYV